MREKESHEKYFESIAGSEEKAKPLLEHNIKIKSKDKETKMEGFVSKLKDQSEKIMEEESKDKIKPKFNQEKQQVKEKELKVIETIEEEIIQPQDI